MTVANSKKLRNHEKTQVITQGCHHPQYYVLQVQSDVLIQWSEQMLSAINLPF